MSGTSLDGIDAAILETDGEKILSFGPSISVPYSNHFKKILFKIIGKIILPDNSVVRELTLKHADVVFSIMKRAKLSPSDIEVIGFHGQTTLHDSQKGITCQIGDGKLLAETLGIPVVNDFRSADLFFGGEGAPLAPIYHKALSRSLKRPIAILNIGGVANVTWIGLDFEIFAFDTGPGNALIDDWVRANDLGTMDSDGSLARSGQVNQLALKELMSKDYFKKSIPKSLDRNTFSFDPVVNLNPEDGAATLTAFSAAAVYEALKHFPEKPIRWLVTGGGRHNKTLMGNLRTYLKVLVEPVEAVGWNGDVLEAQAFAYLAVRSLKKLPISFPNTTGVPRPTVGGVCNSPLYKFKSG